MTKVVADLGWVDLDLVSSPGRWAAAVATYCPSQMVQHPKSKSTKPRSVTTFVTLYITKIGSDLGADLLLIDAPLSRLGPGCIGR